MSKKCRTCHKGEMQSREESYLYRESGLPNIVLVGVKVRRCPECGAHELVLPRAPIGLKAPRNRSLAQGDRRARARHDHVPSHRGGRDGIGSMEGSRGDHA